MFDPSFTRSKYGNKLVELFGRLLLTTIITMIILTMMKKTMIMIVITKYKKMNKEIEKTGLTAYVYLQTFACH